MLGLSVGGCGASGVPRPSLTSFPSSGPQGNYVLDRDELVDAQKPEYDVVLCFSLTKWVHLNWGDEGLKRMFRRIYRHLRPGGILVLEPQPWSSYCKRKSLTVSWVSGEGGNNDLFIFPGIEPFTSYVVGMVFSLPVSYSPSPFFPPRMFLCIALAILKLTLDQASLKLIETRLPLPSKEGGK